MPPLLLISQTRKGPDESNPDMGPIDIIFLLTGFSRKATVPPLLRKRQDRTVLIRKKRGNFLEDFRVGQLFRHKIGKTVTEGLFNAFTEFGMTTNPLSKNLRYAQRYGFRGLIAPPGLVVNIVFSQSVEDISENARQSGVP